VVLNPGQSPQEIGVGFRENVVEARWGASLTLAAVTLGRAALVRAWTVGGTTDSPVAIRSDASRPYTRSVWLTPLTRQVSRPVPAR
jgi:hypothetical protein